MLVVAHLMEQLRSVVLVAPTSTSTKPALFRPDIEIDDRPARILVEKVGTIDINRLGDLAGRFTPADQWGVDAALVTVVGLNQPAWLMEDQFSPDSHPTAAS